MQYWCQSHSADHLDLVLADSYLRKLLGNARIVRYLAQHHADMLPEFQKLVETDGDTGPMNGAASP